MTRTQATLAILCVSAAAMALAGGPPGSTSRLKTAAVPPAVQCLEKLEFELPLPNGRFQVAPTDRHDATDADRDGQGFAAWAEFVGPDDQCQTVPAFFVEAEGRWRLMVRFAPERPGPWRVRWRVTNAGGATAASGWERFVATPSVRTGFLRTPETAGVLDEFSPQVLVVRKGGAYEPFFGIATARAWNAAATPDTPPSEWPDQLIDLERDLFAPMQRHGVNVLIYWFAPWDTQLVHCGSRAEPWTSYDQRRAANMDRVVELAEKYEVKLFLSIWNHPALRQGDRPWELGTYNRGPRAWRNGFAAFGGGLECADFFRAHERAGGKWGELWAHQENLLRYLVARWGYSPAVGAWTTVCLPQGMTGWSYRERFHRWHDSTVRCLRRYDFVGRPLSAVSWRESQPWVGGEEEVDVAQFCVYPPAFYFPRRTMLDARLRGWVVDHMYSRTRSALDGRPRKPVFCGEYGLIERKHPRDTLQSHGRRYPDYLRLASWTALLAGASILPAEWNDGARLGEHVGRDAEGRLLYDNFAELGRISRFVRGDEGRAGDFALDLRHVREPIALSPVGSVTPLGLALRRSERGVAEMIGWLPRALERDEATESGLLPLPGLVPNREYEGSVHLVPAATVSPIRIVTNACGRGLLDLSGHGHDVAFKLRLSADRER